MKIQIKITRKGVQLELQEQRRVRIYKGALNLEYT